MKKLIIITILIGITALASDKDKGQDHISNDVSRVSGDYQQLNVEDLKWQFYIDGGMIVTNSDGTRYLHEIKETRRWQFSNPKGKIVSYWQIQPEGFDTINVKHTWDINKNRQIKATIEQYDQFLERKSAGPQRFKMGKRMQKKEYTIEFMNSVSFVVQSKGSQRVVLRFVPNFWDKSEPNDITGLPIAGKDIVLFDNKEKLWATRVTTDGAFTGIITHRGAVFMSYNKFKGAKVIGSAKNNRIKLTLNPKKKLTIQGSTPFLPRGTVANVYGIYKPEVKTSRLNSVRTLSSSKEEEFVSRIESL